MNSNYLPGIYNICLPYRTAEIRPQARKILFVCILFKVIWQMLSYTYNKKKKESKRPNKWRVEFGLVLRKGTATFLFGFYHPNCLFKPYGPKGWLLPSTRSPKALGFRGWVLGKQRLASHSHAEVGWGATESSQF